MTSIHLVFLVVVGCLSPAFLAARPVSQLKSQAPSSGDASTLVAQARELLAVNNVGGAERLLADALAVSPSHPEANLLAGDLLMKQKKFPEAMDRFEIVLSTSPGQEDARAGELEASLAFALQARRENHQQTALTCLQRAHEHLPDDPKLLHALGIQLYDLGYLAQASEALTQAILLAPHDPQNFYARARTELDREQFPAAEQDFQHYLAERPNDATAHYGYGHLLQMQQRLDEAQQEFMRSIKLQPQQTESYYQLGHIALDQHRDSEAKDFLERTLARSPEHGGALTDMGIIAFRSKDYGTAGAYLRKAVQSSPDYQPAHYYLGLTLAREGDQTESNRELKIALALTAKQQGRSAPVQPNVAP